VASSLVARPQRARIGRRLVEATCIVFVAGTVVVGAGAVGHTLTWNLSSSLPRGLYLLRRGATATAGSIVAFPVPARVAAVMAARRYLPPGTLLLKRIVAMPGEHVCVGDRTLKVNGRLLGPVADRDSAGRRLTAFGFCGDISPGFVFVATASRLSFDSRYFGPVPIPSLIVATPLWTY